MSSATPSPRREEVIAGVSPQPSLLLEAERNQTRRSTRSESAVPSVLLVLPSSPPLPPLALTIAEVLFNEPISSHSPHATGADAALRRQLLALFS